MAPLFIANTRGFACSGKTNEYRAACEQLLTRSGTIADAKEANAVLLTACLLGNAVRDYEHLIRLKSRFGGHPGAAAGFAALNYRLGRYSDVAPGIDLELAAGSPTFNPEAALFAGLALAAVEETEKAATVWERIKTWNDYLEFQHSLGHDFDFDWEQQLNIKSLLNELAGLLKAHSKKR